MATLGDEYPKQQARVREILGYYKVLGPAGRFGTMMIEDLLQRADKAAVEQDVVAMLRCYKEMQGIK